MGKVVRCGGRESDKTEMAASVSAKRLLRSFVLVFTAAFRHLGVVCLLIQEVLCSHLCTKPRETDNDARALCDARQRPKETNSSRNCRRDLGIRSLSLNSSRLRPHGSWSVGSRLLFHGSFFRMIIPGLLSPPCRS
ncbi:hypothetical protein CCMA1212_001363 [Trichoderma ghanense]|uniref:Uncharacterized protein n=1 Tax=Trichoderma ghanense TaxID=65468 RepID=A0ABY2HCC9_9HYPO